MMIRKIENQRYTNINYKPISYTGHNELFKTTIPEVIKCDSARYIANDLRIHYFDACLFRILDYINPFMNNYPKIGNKIANVFEKMIRFNNKLI